MAAVHSLSSPVEDVFVEADPVIGHRLALKCEGYNSSGSIKMRVAVAMMTAAVADSTFADDSILIESSSGNLGVALSAVAATMGIEFVCVTDSRCNSSAINAMTALGTRVEVVSDPDPVGGLLRARLNWIRARLDSDDRYVWLDQYSNEENWRAHYNATAPAIMNRYPDLDVLFVGVGTGGTAMGCARYFRDAGSATRIVAVDPIGSVSFGHPPRRRLIPGLGAGIVPPLLDTRLLDDVVRVSEVDSIRMCRALAATGMLFGGSTGTVVEGARAWLDRHDEDRELTSVAISPDFGDRYLATVYNDSWVLENYDAEALGPARQFSSATS